MVDGTLPHHLQVLQVLVGSKVDSLYSMVNGYRRAFFVTLGIEEL